MITVPSGDLAVEALDASYGPPPVLHGVSFRAPGGAVTALLGANGSGKTTALRAIAGLMDHGGAVSLGPTRLDTLPRQERAVQIAYVPQRTLLDAPLPVEVVVGHGRFLKHTGQLRRDRGAASAVDAALAATGTEALRRRAFTSLSGRVVGAGSALEITGNAPIRDVFGVRVIEGAGFGLALDALPPSRAARATS